MSWYIESYCKKLDTFVLLIERNSFDKAKRFADFCQMGKPLEIRIREVVGSETLAVYHRNKINIPWVTGNTDFFI